MQSIGVLRLVGLSFLVAVFAGCERKTAEERGRELAEERLGIAEGVAAVVDERGGAIGEKAARGLAKIVQGAGTGIRDVALPPVDVRPQTAAVAAGISVQRAHAELVDGRVVEASLAFGQPFQGWLTLAAFDERGVELGVGELSSSLNVLQPGAENARFSFASSTRLSDAKLYKLDVRAPKELVVQQGEGVSAGQMVERGQEVSAYVSFARAFRGRLQLRAFHASGAEIGRSMAMFEGQEELRRSADSAEHVAFVFDERTPLRYAARYELHALAPANP